MVAVRRGFLRALVATLVSLGFLTSGLPVQAQQMVSTDQTQNTDGVKKETPKKESNKRDLRKKKREERKKKRKAAKEKRRHKKSKSKKKKDDKKSTDSLGTQDSLGFSNNSQLR